jgi:hypothetical protein
MEGGHNSGKGSFHRIYICFSLTETLKKIFYGESYSYFALSFLGMLIPFAIVRDDEYLLIVCVRQVTLTF